MNTLTKNSTIDIIASEKIWMESKAIDQLKKTSELTGIIQAFGMPDLHPGKGSPIGAVFLSKGIVYPYIAGNDIGCGMGLWKTELKRQKIKRDRWEKKLSGLENPWNGDTQEWLAKNNFNEVKADDFLGTIGRGNHFAELQLFEKIYDQELFKTLKLNKEQLMLLVHSGSRGLGESLLRAHTDKYKNNGLQENTLEGKEYIEKHNHALRWAKANRALIADRFFSALGTKGTPISDLCHNSITPISIKNNNYWLHRKGAAPSDQGAIIIPGSRGSLSYLVKPNKHQESSGYSLPHGSGRKWQRSECKGRLRNKYRQDALTQTDLGSKVICEDKDLLYEEAPQAYKNIDTIIDELKDRDLITVIASLRPIITYKTRRNTKYD